MRKYKIYLAIIGVIFSLFANIYFDPNCGGKNRYAVTMDDALRAGLTLCAKCVD